MRLAFLGTPDFAVPTLNALVEAGHELALVVAQPDAPAGRGQQLRKPPVAARALELGLPLAQPRAIRSGTFHERFLGLGLDAAVVIAYGRILPRALLDAPRYGCINLHASLLPRFRGAAPIQAAVLAGDAETGVSAQRMVEGLDEGPLYLSRSLALSPRETAGSLHDRLAALSAEVAVEVVAHLGVWTPIPQPEEGVSVVGKIDKADGRVDWSGSASAIDRRVRAMTPWPGGFVDTPAGPFKLLEVEPTEGAGAPGEVLSTRPLVVACGEGALRLDRVQAPGRKPVSGEEYANGARLVVGDPVTGR